MASSSLQERQNKKEHSMAGQPKEEGKETLINASSYAGKE
jgi:hypothetical protein